MPRHRGGVFAGTGRIHGLSGIFPENKYFLSNKRDPAGKKDLPGRAIRLLRRISPAAMREVDALDHDESSRRLRFTGKAELSVAQARAPLATK